TSTKKWLPPYSTGSKRIRYYIRSDYIMTYVKDGFKEIEKKTCLKFKEQKSPVQIIGINFYYNYNDDIIKMSYSKKKPTIVNLKRDTYMLKKMTRFYIGYALGLIPEVTRRDRDSNVIIFKENISYSFERFFEKVKNYPDSYYNTDFDFSSIMMFDSSFGSNYDGNHTYMSKFYPFYGSMINEYAEFSFNDYKRLNVLYCKDQCKKAPKCQNRGYYGSNCDTCNCVYPFAGKFCKSYSKKVGTCEGSFLKAYSSAKTKTFKEYKGECYYIIKAKNSRKKVKLTIVNFKGVGQYKLEVKYRKDKGAAGVLITSDVENFTFPSLSSSVIVTYHADNITNELVLKYQEVK
uniref:Astacin domain-containing protein n=1 Tax=Strongyloides papillosus TaxID=174720 RepID=A0A0N5BKW5_STREA